MHFMIFHYLLYCTTLLVGVAGYLSYKDITASEEVSMSEKNLTPYFLAIGPLLLVGAYMNWPAADVIGNRGMQSLADASDTLTPLLIVATIGTLMVLGGLYLLIGEMMHNCYWLKQATSQFS